MFKLAAKDEWKHTGWKCSDDWLREFTKRHNIHWGKVEVNFHSRIKSFFKIQTKARAQAKGEAAEPAITERVQRDAYMCGRAWEVALGGKMQIRPEATRQVDVSHTAWPSFHPNAEGIGPR